MSGNTEIILQYVTVTETGLWVLAAAREKSATQAYIADEMLLLGGDAETGEHDKKPADPG